FLNWLTILPMLACFDDSFLRKVLPRSIATRAIPSQTMASMPQQTVANVLTFVVIALSITPALNLLSGQQVMNGSFEPLHLVNTYGAFGAVGTKRREIVFEGTSDSTLSEATVWKEYEFKCKPG